MSETPSSDTQPGIDELDNDSSSASDNKKDDGPVEFQDPAILCQRRGNSPINDRRYRYTHSELKALRDEPLCKRVPDCFDSRLVIWRRFGRGGEEEPVSGNGPSGGRERGEPRERRIYDGNNGGPNSSRGELKRGGDKDPRERLKKEDNIILSPQRRSFNMGCQMPAPPPSTNATPALGSSLLRNDRDIINGGRDRRIGSGRILARDVAWDYRPDKNEPESESSSYTNYRGSGGSGNTSSSNFRGEEKPSYESRRSNNYNSENSRGNRDYEGREKDSYSSSRQYGDRNSRYNNSRSSYNDRRRLYSDKDEEPEWFSAGPTSQLETIDLHGFDGPINEEKETRKEKNDEKGGSKHETERSSRDDDSRKSERNEESGHHRSETNRNEFNNNPKVNDTNNNKDQEGNKVSGSRDPQKQLLGEVLGNEGDDFNFEEFLNFDSITGLLASNQESQATREQAGGGSRFSQWFSRDSPTKMLGKKTLFDSRRSSLHDELNNLIGDMSNEMKAPGHPGQNPESNKYFAPISPAANTANHPVGLLDILQRNNGPMGQNPQHAALTAAMKEAMHQQIDNRNLMFLMEQQKSSGMNSPSMSQMPSVEELEARLRGQGGEPSPTMPNNGPRIIAPSNNVGKPNVPSIPMINPDTGVPVIPDTIGFKRLLAQMSDGIPGPINPNLQQLQQQQQANLIQMLSSKQGQCGPNADELKKVFNFMQQMQQGANPQAMPPQGRPIQGQKQLPTVPNAGQDPIGNMLHVANQIPQPHNLQPDLRNTEILKRPEAQLLIQSIIRGEMKPGNLWQQMSNPTITPRQRETLTAVLNTFNSSPRVSSPNLLIPPPAGAPIPPLVPNGGLNPELQAQILLQQQKQQMRVSPLPNAFTVPPVPMATNNPLTLHVPGMPQRIPSPRELQYHTQSIMQNALIRKKLEEQRENFRKRQEAQQAQQNQPASTASNVGNNTGNPVTTTVAPTVSQSQPANVIHSSPVKHTQSPTPLAFTPTSVLRKMTADKGPEEAAAASIVSSSSGSSALLNSIANAGANKGQNSVPPQQRAPQNPQQLSNQMSNMQIGQPIRGVPQRTGGPVAPPQQQPPPQVPIGHQHLPAGANMAWLQQQMQAQAANQVPKPPVGRPIVKQQSSVPIPGQQTPAANPQMMQFNQSQSFDFNAAMQQQQQQQQQQRKAQPVGNPGVAAPPGGNPALTAHQIQQLMAHRQQVQAAQVQQQQQKYLEMQRYRQMMEQQQRQGAGPIPGENPLGDRGLMNFGRDGNLSPTSNQLARWFSPELLAQASAGKLPSINSTQALSLEEFERSMQHSSTTVHN